MKSERLWRWKQKFCPFSVLFGLFFGGDELGGGRRRRKRRRSGKEPLCVSQQGKKRVFPHFSPSEKKKRGRKIPFIYANPSQVGRERKGCWSCCFFSFVFSAFFTWGLFSIDPLSSSSEAADTLQSDRCGSLRFGVRDSTKLS